MSLDVAYDRVIVLFCGAKLFGELGRSQEVAIVGDRLAVQVGQKSVQASLIAQGQHDIQLHDLGERKPPDEFGLAVEHCGAYMVCLHCLSAGRYESDGDNRCDREQHYTHSLIHNSSWHSGLMAEKSRRPVPAKCSQRSHKIRSKY